MAKMGSYCKAHPLKKLRQFGDWTESLKNLNKERGQAAGSETAPLTGIVCHP